MQVQDIKLREIRKKYANSQSKFFIRIRENSNDIVYYNGIKAFEIKKSSENEISEIVMPDSIFTLNKTNIVKFRANSEELITAIKDMRRSLKKYFPQQLEKIVIRIKRESYKSILENSEKRECFIKKLDELRKRIESNKRYSKYIELSDILSISEQINAQYENTSNNQQELKYEIKITNSNNPVSEDEYIEDMVNLEYDVITSLILKEDKTYHVQTAIFSIPIFRYGNSNIQLSKEQYNEFETFIITAIEKYEEQTKTEKEKKYQHLFMKFSNLERKIKDFENIYRFEEEYSTDELNSSEKGRIDCVFAKINKETSKNGYNTEIYLIELKVDEKVIDGTNGVHKHLIDIQNLCKNKSTFENFLTQLKLRIEYRRKELNEEPIEIKIDPKNIHFWTIIAISNRECALEVAKKIIYLTKEENIEKDKVSGKLPKKSIILDDQIKQLKLEGIDVKFFFDKHLANELSDVQLFQQKKIFKDMDVNVFLDELTENKII